MQFIIPGKKNSKNGFAKGTMFTICFENCQFMDINVLSQQITMLCNSGIIE